MKKKILEIMDLAIEISEKLKTDVFVNYAGHVDTLNVRIFENGWVKGTEPTKEWYLDMKYNEEVARLDEILEYLHDLLPLHDTLITKLEDEISGLQSDVEHYEEKIADLENELDELSNGGGLA